MAPFHFQRHSNCDFFFYILPVRRRNNVVGYRVMCRLFPFVKLSRKRYKTLQNHRPPIVVFFHFVVVFWTLNVLRRVPGERFLKWREIFFCLILFPTPNPKSFCQNVATNIDATNFACEKCVVENKRHTVQFVNFLKNLFHFFRRQVICKNIVAKIVRTSDSDHVQNWKVAVFVKKKKLKNNGFPLFIVFFFAHRMPFR